MSTDKNQDYIDQIIEIVNWYSDLPEDYPEVNELMFARQRLSALISNYVLHVVGELAIEWKSAQARNYREKYQLRVEHNSKGTTAARNISKANTANEYEDEMNAEAMFIKSKEWSRSIYAVLDSMNQHISHLKEELKYSRYTNEK